MTGWMRIEAPHMVASLDYAHGLVTETAPILKWARGKRLHDVQAYCRRKGWRFQVFIDPL